MIPWKKYDDEDQPEDGQFCLVCFRDGDMDVRYFVRESWGWYPGGSDPIGTYWVPVEDVPRPADMLKNRS